MTELTYADREVLIQSLDTSEGTWTRDDRQLLVEVGDWSRSLEPRFGFEHGLLRDIAVLSRYLTVHGNETDIARLARGGLLCLTCDRNSSSSRLGRFGLWGKSYLVSYAVHEIRRRLEGQFTYSPPALRKDELASAETLFLEFVECPIDDDEQLATRAGQVGARLAGLTACGLYRRLANNIEFLIEALGNPDRTPENCSYARAGLSYLVCEEDVLDDRLGIIGYLDDNFIAQLAVDLIDPEREPWLALLDDVVGYWPFLNGLVFDDGSGGRSISEFMMINSALSCDRLRNSNIHHTTLVVPTSGPMPLLLGFVSSLGLIQAADKHGINEDSFQFGQKVLVDYCAIAEFAGFDTCGGRRMFKLRQYRNERGQSLRTEQLWPISDLSRLVPANPDRVPRGKITYDSRRIDIPLPALEYLFKFSDSSRIAAVSRQTIVVMPVGYAHELVKRIQVYGHSLLDAIPMGHLVNGEVKPWSSRFGILDPLLIFAPDLDGACEYAEERAERINLLIVDSQGHNANKHTSLNRLRQFDVSTLSILPERSAHELELDDTVTLWNWNPDDFKSLVWPATNSHNGSGPLRDYEKRLRSRFMGEVQADFIPLDAADKSFEAIRTLQRVARERGGEHLIELDDVISLSFGLLTRLLRCATPLTPTIASFQEIKNGLGNVTVSRRECKYFTKSEQDAIGDAEEGLQDLFSLLRRNNPKADAARALLAAQPGLAFICPDSRLALDLEMTYAKPKTRVLTAWGDDSCIMAGAIVPGWFRRDRMAGLLIPPIASPLHLVLYGVEETWYSGFRREHRLARIARSARCARRNIFPGIDGWSKTPKESETHDSPIADNPAQESGFQALTAIHEYVSRGSRQRIYSSAVPNGAEATMVATLVHFDGGPYSFLTDSYEANVVTHLLCAITGGEDNKPDIQQKSVSELVVGDALLFHRGSDRDVIRAAADRILPPGIRDTASLWQDALRGYASKARLTPEQVHRRLREAGCSRQHQAVKNWLESDYIIGPKSHAKDVPIIANVTKDPNLKRRMDDVLTAIGDVRIAHIRASHQLAREVVAHAVDVLRDRDAMSPIVELGGDVVIVRVEEIDIEATKVRASICNRLQEDCPWRE